MKTLLIMRHAKSAWRTEAPSDHDRPLAPRGIKAARRVGRFLTRVDQVPELVIASTAVRAAETARLAVEGGSWPCPVETTGGFYASGAEAVLHRIAEVKASVMRLMVVGHEPTWSHLVAALSGGVSVNMPTAAVACLELADGTWHDLAAGCAQLQWLVTPRLLKAAVR